MADLFASLDDLLQRLDWTLDDVEKRVALSALEDLSSDARRYGSSSWTSVTAPEGVRTMVLRAAVRYMRNPDGYVQSRAGDEIVGWAPRKEAGAPEFSAVEKDDLKDLGRRSASLRTVGIYVYESGPATPKRDIHVPVNYGGKGMVFP